MTRDPSAPRPERYTLPALGNDPSTRHAGTTPGSFANPPAIGGALTFSSPDTPGMPTA
jgi:phosphomethylpyrimidine synthase